MDMPSSDYNPSPLSVHVSSSASCASLLPRCWLNLSSPASAATLVPLPLLLLLSLYLLLTAIVAADDSGRRPISAEVYSRAK